MGIFVTSFFASLGAQLLPNKQKQNLPHPAKEAIDSITNSMDMNLSNLQKIVKDREARHAAVHGVAKSQTQGSVKRTEHRNSQDKETI